VDQDGVLDGRRGPDVLSLVFSTEKFSGIRGCCLPLSWLHIIILSTSRGKGINCQSRAYSRAPTFSPLGNSLDMSIPITSFHSPHSTFFLLSIAWVYRIWRNCKGLGFGVWGLGFRVQADGVVRIWRNCKGERASPRQSIPLSISLFLSLSLSLSLSLYLSLSHRAEPSKFGVPLVWQRRRDSA